MIRQDVSVRRTLRIVSVAMITAGAVIFGDVAMTLAWQEPVSSIYGALNQGRAAEELAQVEESFAAEADLTEVAKAPNLERKAAVLARQFAAQADEGTGIGRIKIPSVGVNYVFLDGTDTSTLQRGPGRYPETAFPGQGRTVGIAGHRTTYSAPFREIDDINEGDEIIVEMPYASFTYEMQKSEIVKPTDVQIVDDVGRERLVLTACHPLFSAAERYAVFADLTNIELNEDLGSGNGAGGARASRTKSSA